MPTRPPRHKPAGYRRVVPGPEPRPAPKVHTHRLGATQRGYDSAWRRAAKAYLLRHALCVHCLARGIVERATVVDHIKPHKLSEAIRSGDPDRVAEARALFWDAAGNWQALCAPCHNSKTASHDGGFGNRERA